MTRSIFVAVLAVMLMGTSCKQGENKEITRLTQLSDSLRNEAIAKDTSINSMLASFNEIESNLTVIKEKQALISLSSKNGEITPDARVRIKEDIQLINDLLAKNKRTIYSLRNKLKESGLKVEELQKMIEQLNQSIIAKDSEIADLKDQLTKLNFTVASLNSSIDTLKNDNKQMSTTIEGKTKELNTAYYIVGTKKDLIAKSVLTKEGGFIGINSTVKMKQDFDESAFEKIDIRELNTIDVQGKKVKIVSTHPAGSYRLETNAKGAVEKIQITNPTKFWSVSKYLVVMY